jgi:hypothetical protein
MKKIFFFLLTKQAILTRRLTLLSYSVNVPLGSYLFYVGGIMEIMRERRETGFTCSSVPP